MDMQTVLTACRSSDNVTRNQAEQLLQTLEESNFPVYVSSLASEIRSDDRSEPLRQLAGILIKNALDSDNDSRALQKHQRWRDLEAGVRLQVRGDLVMSLSAGAPLARAAAAGALAKIGKIEVPAKLWPDLISGLSGAALTDGVAVGTKAASITTLGYLCDEIDDVEAVAQADRDLIMSAIVTGMQPEQPVDVKRAATSALNNSLDFAEASFGDDKAGERAAIVNAVIGAAGDADHGVRTAAFECVVRMAELYYERLAGFMDALAALTSAAALGPEQDVAVRAVEFWTTLAAEEGRMEAGNPHNLGYVRRFAAPLVGMLTALMATVDADDDDDAYTTAQAASNCLSECAEAAGDDLVAPVMAFVGEHFASPSWQHRDAATQAFGCLMGKVSSKAVAPLIAASVGMLISRLAGPGADPHAGVRDSTAWTLCKIMENHFDDVDLGAHYGPLLAAVVAALEDEARVAANAAFIVHNMAQHMRRFEQPGGTTPLSPHFADLTRRLLARGDRPDWQEHKLRTACVEAVNMMVSEASADAERGFLYELLTEVGRRLTVAIGAAPATPEQRADLESQLVLLTAMAQELVGELGDAVAPVAAGLVELLLRTLDAQHAIAAEQAFRALGAIADALGEGFGAMLPSVMPRVLAGITDRAHGRICDAAVWAAGEVVRSAGAPAAAYVEAIVEALLAILREVDTPKNAKVGALGVFGDIATVLGAGIERYLRGIMIVLDRAAGSAPPPEADEDDLEFIESLHTAVAEAWQGILQAFIPEPGLAAAARKALADQAMCLAQYVPSMIAYLRAWGGAAVAQAKAATVEGADEVEPTLEHLKGIVGVLGDMCAVFGKAALTGHLNKNEAWLRELLYLEDAREKDSWEGGEHDASGVKKTTLADYAQRQLPSA